MGPRHRTRTRLILMVQLAFLGAVVQTSTAYAQLVPSVGAASAPAEDPMERAKRQADNVMRWIKVHADKPRAAPAATAAPAAATPPPVAARPVAPRPVAPTPAAPEPQRAVVALPPPIEVPAPAPVVFPSPAAPVEPAVVAPVEPPVEPAVVAPVASTPPVEEEDEAPLNPISQDQPVIPRNVLASLDFPVKIIVQFRVEANGSVSNVAVLSSNRMQLNRPTVAAVSSWRFEPVKTPRVAQIEFAFNP